MGSRGWLSGGALAVLLLAGCGSSGHSSTTSSGTPAKPPAGLAGRLLTTNELPGFTGHPGLVDVGAHTWLTDTATPVNQIAAEQARLTRLGFVQAVREELVSQSGNAGLSLVEQFRTSAGARGELAFQGTQFKRASIGHGQYKSFAVPAIPGSVGFGVVKSGHGGINVAFVKGPYYYLVGRTVAGGSIEAAVGALAVAAQHLYQRVSS